MYILVSVIYKVKTNTYPIQTHAHTVIRLHTVTAQHANIHMGLLNTTTVVQDMPVKVSIMSRPVLLQQELCKSVIAVPYIP